MGDDGDNEGAATVKPSQGGATPCLNMAYYVYCGYRGQCCEYQRLCAFVRTCVLITRTQKVNYLITLRLSLPSTTTTVLFVCAFHLPVGARARAYTPRGVHARSDGERASR